MTVQFTCDCCGTIAAIPEYEEGVTAPPKGWRKIHTLIKDYDESMEYSAHHGECLHSCADCNSNMSVSEHLEAEFESRKHDMDQGGDRREWRPAVDE